MRRSVKTSATNDHHVIRTTVTVLYSNWEGAFQYRLEAEDENVPRNYILINMINVKISVIKNPESPNRRLPNKKNKFYCLIRLLAN